MEISFRYNAEQYVSDLSCGIDISIPLISGAQGPKCFYAPPFIIEPVRAGNFIGDIEMGSNVNFKNIFINPHGNGTHTECCGHIIAGPYTINQCLDTFHFISRLITVVPEILDGEDAVINRKVLHSALENKSATEAVIVRTIPNNADKMTRDYSGTNPAYFSAEAIAYLNKHGINHLLTDLPSIDKEDDGGRLEAHREFWGIPGVIHEKKTITEMVYIDNIVEDGLYLCNIQIAGIESDASPSKIVLYKMKASNI